MNRPAWPRRARASALGSIAAGAVLTVAVATATASGPPAVGTIAASAFHSRVFASGTRIGHRTSSGIRPISQPDDITYLAGHIFVGFQNGVGPQGQASTSGNRESTVVEFDLQGHRVAQWDVTGKCDGVTADPASGKVIATVDEDAHSSVYLIDPTGAAVHYRYSAPLASKGGTDAIEVYRGMILISASAPGTTGAAAPQAAYPAVYRASFDAHAHVARLRPLFFDESVATDVNTNSAQRGQRVHLALTDPDSNEDVPAFAGRFAGQFMLTSQGDEEQIFVAGAGTAHQSLSVLKLTASVDDTAWPTGPTGSLYTTDNSNNTIERITGPFARGSEVVATTPCDENSAPSTCPGPGFPPNYLGRVNPDTGLISRVVVTGAPLAPQGMLFLP
jgi:TusA-related sulfurtransferase